MSTNAADPDRLHGYAVGLRAQAQRSRAGVHPATLALTAHNLAGPDFAVDLAAVRAALDVTRTADRLAAETDLLAAAFVAADRSGTRVRRAETGVIVGLLGAVGGVSSPDGTLRHAEVHGRHVRADGSVVTGPLRVDAEGEILVGTETVADGRLGWEDGRLTAEVWGHAFAGARAGASVDADLGPAAASGSVTAEAGASASGRATGSVGLDGARGRAEADAFVGARVTAEGQVEAGPAAASGEVTAGFGLGAGGHVDGELTWDRISLAYGLEAFLGPGLGWDGTFTVNPRQAASIAADGADAAWQRGTQVLDAGGRVAGRGGRAVLDGLDDAAGALHGVLGGGTATLRGIGHRGPLP